MSDHFRIHGRVPDGTGYVENGREIFDEDDDDDPDDRPANSKASGSRSGRPTADAKSKKRLRDINAPINEKSNIKRLFGNAVNNKRTETAPKLAEDDILSDILGEMDTDKSSMASQAPSALRPSPMLALRRSSKDGSEKRRVNQFMQSFATGNAAGQKLDKNDDVGCVA